MGVPAFYRWLSEKYPKIVVDILEKRSIVVNNIEIPLNLNEENPNEIEFDNLYVDMNGLIHPCSHPEDREAPSTEEEMYINIMKYVDRLFAAIRPRRLLYLAIDGVAPRAKMNQQRSRRFRAAQDSAERQKMLEEVREEMISNGLSIPPKKDGPEWDSNVITPGTEFMNKLSTYIWFYILNKMNNNPAWRNIKVLFSDASVPGEGEHKIMEFIRSQRSQPGYDPNQKHVIHGLDADLIMLALATHEVHFTILREKVTFSKRDKDKPQISEAQRLLNEQSKLEGASISALHPEDEWVYSKPLQALHIHVLRDYLYNEFKVLSNIRFGFDFERIVDDFVFMCFFVGNDFLPHLPSLDIRDGAIDFLLQCYKDMLESLGDYLTSPGGNVNLHQVDIILSRVGEVEDEVFRRRKIAEDEEDKRREYYKNKNNLNKNIIINESNTILNHEKTIASIQPLGRDVVSKDVDKSVINQSNKDVAQKLRESLLGKRSISQVESANEIEAVKLIKVDTLVEDSSSVLKTDPLVEEITIDEVDGEIGDVIPILPIDNVSEEVKEELKKRIKAKEDSVLDKYKTTIKDNIRLHETGWRQRYYEDQYKKEDIEQGGGLKRMCVTYVEGLCWVLKYYYEGCPSWNWYYPFHYAPFASDLINIDKYVIKFEKSHPFRPVEQLLAVLPSQSAHALPEECQWLMTESRSPIYDLYVSDAPLDPNGKHLPWLWVLLLPFIDEKRIVDAYNLCKSKMSIMSRRRNAFGYPVIFLRNNHKITSMFISTIKYEVGNETDTEILSIGSNNLITNNLEYTLPSDKVFFSCELGDGICGNVAKPLPQYYVSIGKTINCPKEPPHALEDVQNNQIVCLTYELPRVDSVHKSSLLPGVQIPPSILSDFDLMPRRPPRLGRGKFNMLDIMYSDSNHNSNHNNNRTSYNIQNMSYQQLQSTNQPQLYNNNNNFNGNQNNYVNYNNPPMQQQLQSFSSNFPRPPVYQQNLINSPQTFYQNIPNQQFNQQYQTNQYSNPLFGVPQPHQVLLSMDSMRSQLAQMLQGRPPPPSQPQIVQNPFLVPPQLPNQLQYNQQQQNYQSNASTNAISNNRSSNTTKQLNRPFTHSAPMGFGQQPYDPRKK